MKKCKTAYMRLLVTICISLIGFSVFGQSMDTNSVYKNTWTSKLISSNELDFHFLDNNILILYIDSKKVKYLDNQSKNIQTIGTWTINNKTFWLFDTIRKIKYDFKIIETSDNKMVLKRRKLIIILEKQN